MKYKQQLALLLFIFVLAACGSTRQEEAQKADKDTRQKTENEIKTLGQESTRSEEGRLGMPLAKRVGPPNVTPLIIGNLRIEAVHWGKERGFQQNGGYIAAYDVATGKELWTLKVYTINYDDKMEEDVQDIFIETISKGNTDGTIELIDEHGRHFFVDLESHSVRNK